MQQPLWIQVTNTRTVNISTGHSEVKLNLVVQNIFNNLIVVSFRESAESSFIICGRHGLKLDSCGTKKTPHVEMDSRIIGNAT